MIKYIPYYKSIAWMDRDDTEFDFFFPAGIEVKSAPPVRIMAEQELAEKMGTPFDELPELLEESPELREELKGLISKYKAQFPTPDEIVWVEVDKEMADALGLVKKDPWEALPSVGYCNLSNFPDIEALYKRREASREERLEYLTNAFDEVKKAAAYLGMSTQTPSFIWERGYSDVTASIRVEYNEGGYTITKDYTHVTFPGFLEPAFEAIVEDLRKWQDRSLKKYREAKALKEKLASFYENQRKENLAKGEVAELSDGVVVKLDADGFTVRVPDWAVPHLIGKGGQKIKAASQALGRRIKLVSYPDQNKPRKTNAWWLI
jgi:hypothetical protein